jgi:hypothetical protein
METLRKAATFLCVFVLISIWPNIVNAESLESYAKKCDAAIGVTVPDFNCDNGTPVPTTHLDIFGNCDEPNRLNKECDPGSMFTVLSKNTPSVFVVAHCRKKGYGPGRYGDIAVIQTHRKTGATCFYQSHVSEASDGGEGLNGDVKAPSKGTGAWPWMTPAQAALAGGCVSCHDNGAVIRSPYLAQLKTGADALPGATDNMFNKNQPYGFVGEDFYNWKTYKVEVDGNLCISCHRLGVSNRSSRLNGTSIDFALRATGQALKPPPNSNDPGGVACTRRA